ncbi:unnamed protein product [Heterobilharzia americana]|nr:unnamed protein product [Heterobilharzia americana]
MLQEVQDALRRRTPNIRDERKKRFWKCPHQGCDGFACTRDFRCTLCNRIVLDSSGISNTNVEVVYDPCSGTPTFKRPRTAVDHYLVPLNIFSIGRSGIFDGRLDDCRITSSAIYFKVKVEGIWTSINIPSESIARLVFCEVLQVIFLKPHNSFKSQLSSLLKLKEFVLPNVKWLFLVFREPSVSDPFYLTTNVLEGLANNIRENGSCDLKCDAEKAREILTSCGLRLPRAELKRTALATESHASYQVDQNKAENEAIHISDTESSSSQIVKYTNEGGLLTNVLNTFANSGIEFKNGSGSSTWGMSSEKSAVNECDKERDDLIILSDESTGDWVQNVQCAAQSNSTVLPTNCGDDSFKFDYKPPGSTDSVTLTDNDIACLIPGGLINDAIINFYLKYLYFEQLTESQKQATYLFNVFFYSRLASCNPSSHPVTPGIPKSSETANQTILVQHANVAKWTRRVDLFSKDYIIIPINESAHWFLGLVCYPWMAGMVSYTALYRQEVYHLCQLTKQFSDVDRTKFSEDVFLSNIDEEVIQRLPTDAPGDAFDRWRRRRLAWLRKRGVNAMPCVLLLIRFLLIVELAICMSFGTTYRQNGTHADQHKMAFSGLIRIQFEVLVHECLFKAILWIAESIYSTMWKCFSRNLLKVIQKIIFNTKWLDGFQRLLLLRNVCKFTTF